MAYSLSILGGSSQRRVLFNSSINLSSTFEIKVDMEIDNANSFFVFAGGSNTNNFVRVNTSSGNSSVLARLNESTVRTIDLGADLKGTRFLLTVGYDGSNFYAYTEGNPSASTPAGAGKSLIVDRVGEYNVFRGDGDFSLYSLEFYQNGILSNRYFKQDLSDPNDTVLPDAEGGNDGVLQNFPTDNSQWVFYSAPSAGVTVNVTESTSDFSESSSTSFSANISAQVTEVNASFTESSSATITNNIVSVSVTETSQDFSESASASISGSLSAIVTELSQSFTESSTAEISANISAAVTELAQDFNESAQVNLISSFTVEVTETTSDFEESCYIQLPVIRLTPRKTISVSNRSGGTIRVRRRSSVIRVK